MSTNWLATPDEIDSDDLAITIASRLIGHQIGFWFVTDGQTVSVRCYRDRIHDEETTVTLQNVDEITRHRRDIRANSGAVSQEDEK
jgi:hypothetical protein